MAAGKKKYNIEVFELIKFQSDSGAENETYQLKYKLKAETKFNNNSIQILNDEIVQTDRVSFVVYKRNIVYTDRIKFNNIDYSIISINPLSYSNELEIICEKINI